MRFVAYLVVFAALMSCAESTAPSHAALMQSAPAASYIVLFENATPDAPGLARKLASAHGTSPRYIYSHAVKGFAARLSANAAEALRHHPDVIRVELDGKVTTQDVQPNPPSWGLDRIDERLRPVDLAYRYDYTGQGVRVYVLDTGIDFTHVEFGGRAVSGYDFIDNDADASDCAGHGTHVAGTIGGTTTGVAKQATLVSVRVLGCDGTGEYSTVIAGVDWVTAQGAGGVANMSLGGGYSQAMNDAVDASVESGVVYAIAAGNSAIDACGVSPASTPAALTVGASTPSDQRATFSNYGPCLDLFAPGQSITSSLNGGGYGSKSGTSMSSPHVAGVAALYRSAFPTASVSETIAAILDGSTTGLILDNRLSPNRLLYSIVTGGGEPPLPPPPPYIPPPGPVHAGDIDKGSVTLSSTSYSAGYSFLVHDGAHAPIVGAVVTYGYTSTTLGGAIAVLTCTTGSTGRCGAVAAAALPKQKRRQVTVTVSVRTITVLGVAYDATANHDPDGDSDGTQLTIVVR